MIDLISKNFFNKSAGVFAWDHQTRRSLFAFSYLKFDCELRAQGTGISSSLPWGSSKKYGRGRTLLLMAVLLVCDKENWKQKEWLMLLDNKRAASSLWLKDDVRTNHTPPELVCEPWRWGWGGWLGAAPIWRGWCRRLDSPGPQVQSVNQPENKAGKIIFTVFKQLKYLKS